MNATRSALTSVATAVAAWWNESGEEDRLLLAGIKLGCEASIGWQTWSVILPVSMLLLVFSHLRLRLDVISRYNIGITIKINK